MRPYSQDLRDRIVDTVARGEGSGTETGTQTVFIPGTETGTCTVFMPVSFPM